MSGSPHGSGCGCVSGSSMGEVLVGCYGGAWGDEGTSARRGAAALADVSVGVAHALRGAPPAAGGWSAGAPLPGRLRNARVASIVALCPIGVAVARRASA